MNNNQSIQPTKILTKVRIVLWGGTLMLTTGLACGTVQTSAAAPAQPQSLVDTSTGAPQAGRNPASQGQTSLAAAASMPVGAGMRTDNPAANVKGAMKHVHPSEVLPDTKKTGVTAGGCLLGYGTTAQCLPAASVINAPPTQTCELIKKLFSGGIAITGTDTLHLGKGGSSACEKAAAPTTTSDTSSVDGSPSQSLIGSLRSVVAFTIS